VHLNHTTIVPNERYQYVLKTDDDCYVAVDALLRRIDTGEFPTERLYYGRFLGGQWHDVG
jgi:hypothetical protein